MSSGLVESDSTSHGGLPVDGSEILKGLRAGRWSVAELMKCHFCPYYPQSLNPPADGIVFSQTGLQDMRNFIEENENELRAVGIQSSAVVGSAASNLAGGFPFGVSITWEEEKCVLRRTPAKLSDIDTNIYVQSAESAKTGIDTLSKLAALYRKEGKFKSPPDTLSWYFIAIDELKRILETETESYAFVSAIFWQNVRVDLMSSDVFEDIRTAALQRFGNDERVQRFTWQNLADRYELHQARLGIKSGATEEIVINKQFAPTIFIPNKGLTRGRVCIFTV